MEMTEEEEEEEEEEKKKQKSRNVDLSCSPISFLPVFLFSFLSLFFKTKIVLRAAAVLVLGQRCRV